MFKRISIAIAIVGLVFSGAALMATSAQAASYSEFCTTSSGTGHCPNAWNGQSLVKNYTNDVLNDAFHTVSLGGSTVEFVSDTAGADNGLVISDYLNNSQDAKAGLNGGAPWGYKFNIDASVCSGGSVAYKNFHWGGYLNIGGADGNQAYLNSSPQCFFLRFFMA